MHRWPWKVHFPSQMLHRFWTAFNVCPVMKGWWKSLFGLFLTDPVCWILFTNSLFWLSVQIYVIGDQISSNLTILRPLQPSHSTRSVLITIEHMFSYSHEVNALIPPAITPFTDAMFLECTDLKGGIHRYSVPVVIELSEESTGNSKTCKSMAERTISYKTNAVSFKDRNVYINRHYL